MRPASRSDARRRSRKPSITTFSCVTRLRRRGPNGSPRKARASRPASRRRWAIIEGEICTVASRVLAKLASDRMLERAMNDFAGHVKSLLRDGLAGVVTIHAPHDLVGRLQERLATFGCLEFVTHDSAEVWVRSGATMIETRLEGWRSDHFSGE